MYVLLYLGSFFLKMKEIDKVIINLENNLAKHKTVINELAKQFVKLNFLDVERKHHDDFITGKNGLLFTYFVLATHYFLAKVY